jgi:hypothetical protein
MMRLIRMKDTGEYVLELYAHETHTDVLGTRCVYNMTREELVEVRDIFNKMAEER